MMLSVEHTYLDWQRAGEQVESVALLTLCPEPFFSLACGFPIICDKM